MNEKVSLVVPRVFSSSYPCICCHMGPPGSYCMFGVLETKDVRVEVSVCLCGVMHEGHFTGTDL